MSDVIYGLAGPPPDPPATEGKFRPFGKEGFSFKAILDVINPLQHIPVVSSAYRVLTGEEIAFVPRVLGGALFGGPIGLITALINAVVKEASGRDLGETAVALVTDEASSYVVADQDADPGSDSIPSAIPGAIPGATLAGAAAARPEMAALPPPPPSFPVADPRASFPRAGARIPSSSPSPNPSPADLAAHSLLYLRVPTVAEPATSAAAEGARREPASAEIPDRSADWFMRSLSLGLQKYERASRLEGHRNEAPTRRIDG